MPTIQQSHLAYQENKQYDKAFYWAQHSLKTIVERGCFCWVEYTKMES